MCQTESYLDSVILCGSDLCDPTGPIPDPCARSGLSGSSARMITDLFVCVYIVDIKVLPYDSAVDMT